MILFEVSSKFLELQIAHCRALLPRSHSQLDWPHIDKPRAVLIQYKLLQLEIILQGIVSEGEVLLQTVAPSTLQIIMHDVIVKIDVCALFILLCGCFGLLMPLHSNNKSDLRRMWSALEATGVPGLQQLQALESHA